MVQVHLGPLADPSNTGAEPSKEGNTHEEAAAARCSCRCRLPYLPPGHGLTGRRGPVE